MTLLTVLSSRNFASLRYDQGILDVGLTDEDNVELVKTHTFLRKHATGAAKIELHVLTVERGLSFDEAVEKYEELEGGNHDGFYLSHTVSRQRAARPSTKIVST